MASDRPASWRMPTEKQFEKMAAEAARQPPSPTPDAVLSPRPGPGWIPIQQRRLSEIPRHVLRVECRRCLRTVEIQKLDAIRFYGEHATWKDVGQKLLDNTCPNRTGRYEEDGCWPRWDNR